MNLCHFSFFCLKVNIKGYITLWIVKKPSWIFPFSVHCCLNNIHFVKFVFMLTLLTLCCYCPDSYLPCCALNLFCCSVDADLLCSFKFNSKLYNKLISWVGNCHMNFSSVNLKQLAVLIADSIVPFQTQTHNRLKVHVFNISWCEGIVVVKLIIFQTISLFFMQLKYHSCGV